MFEETCSDMINIDELCELLTFISYIHIIEQRCP